MALGVAITVLAIPAGANAVTTSEPVLLEPQADAHASSATPGRNYGGVPRLRASGSPRVRSFLRFDTGSVSVQRATLAVFVKRSTSSPGPVRLHPVAGAWNESTLTDRNAPPVAAPVAARRHVPAGRWLTFDATELVPESGVVDLALTSGRRGGRVITSRETGRRAPRLVVTEPPPETQEPAPQEPPPVDDGGTQLRGVQLHSLWGGVPASTVERELDLAAAAGSSAVRIDIGWASLEERGRGVLSGEYVERVQHFLDEAEERGLEVIFTLWSSPCWASSAPASLKDGCSGAWWERDVQMYPPSDPADYADAAAWVAQRWGGQIAALEVWNEPNQHHFFRTAQPAADYARLARATYPAVKRVAPDLPVLAGAMAQADAPFLEQLYDAGMQGSYDGIAYHPYNDWRHPAADGEPGRTEYTFMQGTEWMRQVMVNHGDADVGLWATELGWSSCKEALSRFAVGDLDDFTDQRVCVDEALQAEYLAEAFRMAERWPYVEAMIAYNLRNVGTDPRSRLDQYGLLHQDFTPKPAYRALQDVLQR